MALLAGLIREVAMTRRTYDRRGRAWSLAFIDGSRLPLRYTCDGAGDEPPVQAGTVPPSTSESCSSSRTPTRRAAHTWT